MFTVPESAIQNDQHFSLVPLKLKMFSPSGEQGEPVLRTMSDGDMQDTGEVSGDGGTFR